MAKQSASECSSSSGQKKHRKTGIDPKWNFDFPWMAVAEEGEGMLCSLCKKPNRRPKKVLFGRAIWVDIPCKKV